jgi:anti-anti-sigma factor
MESIVIEYRPDAYPALESAVLGALGSGAPRVMLDLGRLTALDTAGVRGLITLLRRSRTAGGGQVVLVGGNPDVRRTLEVTALDRLFEVVRAEDAA